MHNFRKLGGGPIIQIMHQKKRGGTLKYEFSKPYNPLFYLKILMGTESPRAHLLDATLYTKWYSPAQGGGGGTQSILDGRSDIFFFGPRDLSRVFLGFKKNHVFTYLTFSFRVFVAISGSEKIFIHVFQKKCCLVFLGGWKFGCQVFLRSNFSGLCNFLGLQYEVLLDPPSPCNAHFEYPLIR